MVDFYRAMEKARIPYSEYGLTAIDAYYGYSMESPVKFFATKGSMVDLAKVFEAIEYPSLPYADVSIGRKTIGFEARILCGDSNENDIAGLQNTGATEWGSFRRDPRDGRFYDPAGIYEALRQKTFTPSPSSCEGSLFETATLLSRFSSPSREENFPPMLLPERPSALWQKDLLSVILQGPGSARSLELLRESGFIQTHWPRIAELLQVDHAKDCHPEGGGWSHTLEALGHRKSYNLTLSLAILLHDVGKPHSEAAEGRKFDKHAEIGAQIAAKFLRSLGFEESIVSDVQFLIRWHMLPAALPKIPPGKVEDLVLDSRFPTLMELYRCDEFSTFKGPDMYYAACAAYKTIMRNAKNPYRDINGRKSPQSFSSTRS
jgi:poly(A) polymerase